MSAWLERVLSPGRGGADLLCCALFGAVSVAGTIWIYLRAVCPVLAVW